MSSEINDARIKGFIDMLEALIETEASHSSACKNWLMTILTGFILLCKSLDTMPNYLYLLFPIAIFGYLDAYYLGREAWYRTIYKDFLNKAKEHDLTTAFVITEKKKSEHISDGLCKIASPSVWPFYLGIAAACYLLYKIFS